MTRMPADKSAFTIKWVVIPVGTWLISRRLIADRGLKPITFQGGTIILWNGNINMERQADLAKFRLKLWDRFVTMNRLYKVNMSFDQFWYEFLTKQFLTDFPIEKVYEEVCDDLEKRVRLHG